MDDLQHKLCSALEISKNCGVAVQHRMGDSADCTMLFCLHHKGNLNIFRGKSALFNKPSHLPQTGSQSVCDLNLTVVRVEPLDDIFLLLDSEAQRITQSDLSKVLQSWVDGVTDGVVEHALHASHQHLQSLYHCNHLWKHNSGSGMGIQVDQKTSLAIPWKINQHPSPDSFWLKICFQYIHILTPWMQLMWKWGTTLVFTYSL